MSLVVGMWALDLGGPPAARLPFLRSALDTTQNQDDGGRRKGEDGDLIQPAHVGDDGGEITHVTTIPPPGCKHKRPDGRPAPCPLDWPPMRLLRGFVVTLVVVGLLAFFAGLWVVRRSFPVIDGTVTMSGLDGDVTIARDNAGIPHITASSLEDLFRAQGYVHAQDRFWQMDTWRHIGAGRVAEMFGEGQVETDMFLRTLGFERLAAAEYEAMPADFREALDAYAAGVNAYLADRPGGSPLSLEYAVLGIQNSSYEPQLWEPIDTLMWGHVMAWDLRSNLEAEIDRALVSAQVGPEAAEELYPPYPADHPLIVSGAATAQDPVRAPETARAASALEAASANIQTVQTALGRAFEGIGSNSWVVDGTRTASGLPILANDPHLGIQLPSIWYQATLWCEDVTVECPLRVSGFTFPGAPGVVIGHNEDIAWGVTNEGPDTMDLFIERTRGDQYEVEGQWRDFESRTETIQVAGGDDIEMEIRSTRHGPVISDTYGALDPLAEVDAGLPDEYAISLAWQALEPSTIFQAIFEINRAGDWDEFRRAASLFDIAPQNLVYADVEGHIGYQATGEIPMRRSGDGRYPVPGWTAEYEWDGFIPFEELPSVLDPPSGMIVTANQPLVDAAYPHLIGLDHDHGYRAARITELLEASDSLTSEDMTEIQMDNFDASAALIVPRIVGLEGGDGIDTMQDVLGRWSTLSEPFQMDADSPGAAAYGAVWRHLLARTFDELPVDHEAGGSSRFFEVMRHLFDDPDNHWWDDAATDERERASDILEQAVGEAYRELTTRLGDDPEEWRWADLHVASFENQTVGQSGIAPIEALFNRTPDAGVGGGASIVNATGWYPPEGYGVVAVPSMRMVVDLSDLSASRAVHTTGQSGHAYHRNYFDMADDWAEGRTRRWAFDPANFEAEAVLRLVP